MRGWPANLNEGPVGLRPLRLRDASTWREVRIRNAEWLRPWEPTNPETPLYRTTLGPYVSMARTMRREARQGLTLPWVVTYDGQFAGQLTVGGIVWGSARSAQVRTADRTGVEMEALTCVSVAGLALIDMVKAVDPAAVITDVRVEEKTGGKTGLWRRP